MNKKYITYAENTDEEVYLINHQVKNAMLVKGKIYKWLYTPVNPSFRDSKCVCEYIGRFTGKYDDISRFARMAILDEVGGYILADPQSLQEV